MEFTQKDHKQIQSRGSNLETVLDQLERFREGFPFTKLVEPATVSNGIKVLTMNEKEEAAAYFDQQKNDYKICRFVPASGAATRMFKDLFALKDELKGKSRQKQLEYVKASPAGQLFFDQIEKYPFFKEMGIKGNETPDKLLDMLLGEKGLNYGSLPKGMISFHNYGKVSRTAFEEHLHEAARIAGSSSDIYLHFTISEEHLSGFKSIENAVVPALESAYEVTYHISFSFQKKTTDTIAVDMENNPFRDQDGKLVFRPGGHGALIENLNDLEADLIFINNIDNVSPDKNSQFRILHKKMLGGLLIKYLEEARSLNDKLPTAQSDDLEAAKKWLEESAGERFDEDFNNLSLQDKKDILHQLLDRPLRICGMVKNEGDPGGGPFFTKNSEGKISLQIVEKSQVDIDEPEQSGILNAASHFNPVDIVCSISNASGKKYDLTEYIDHNTGFISKKSVKGKELKAQELPGLWNGSMAGWLTVFVEVPSATFTPVKTIFDLVKAEHSNK